MSCSAVLGVALLIPQGQVVECDVAVYGATPAGVAAAITVASMGHRAVLLEPGHHVGGMTSNGLGATDIGNKAAIGGLARSFYRRLGLHYARPGAWRWQRREEYRSARRRPGEPEMWTFEPHVAETVLRDMLAEAGVELRLEERLRRPDGVRRSGARIVSIRMESGLTVVAAAFVDAGYEGDLMAGAGVRYTVGRESNATYGETLDGVQPKRPYHQWKVAISPYVVEDDPTSGLLPGVHAGDPGRWGQGDHRVQAYNFRMCLTDVPANRRPWPKPEGYDPARYELLLRYVRAGVWDAFCSNTPMPNRKTDTNNCGAFSTDNIGRNYDYPDGDYATRARIVRDHVVYQQGLMWFLANDPRVPAAIRAEIGRWGPCKDEFPCNDGWPCQLYVREARRMVAEVVMTQHHCEGRRVAPDPVGLAAYTMDSHNVQRYVQNGRVWNEGDVQVGGFPPYPISYRAIVPRRAECENLAVPVCLSASHIAYGSIRMEPVFMVLGQSAGAACVLAVRTGRALQDLDYAELRDTLRAGGQVLEWKGPRPRFAAGRRPDELAGTIVDEREAELEGGWIPSRSLPGYVGDCYLHDGNTGKGLARARFPVRVARAGRHRLRVAYTAAPNRARNVPIRVRAGGVELVVTLNQRRAEPAVDGFFDLGVFELRPGEDAWVEVRNRGTDGHVVVDALQILFER